MGAGAAGRAVFGGGSWFKACNSCVKPPWAGVAGSGFRDTPAVNFNPLSGAGSCLSDFSGSSWGGAADVEKMRVNSPGPLLAGVGWGAGAPACADGSAAGLENMRVNAPGSLFAAGGGSAGPLVPWPARNVRVNSPGPEFAGAAGACAGTGGALGSAAGGTLIELNIRVNAPGSEPA